MKKGLLLVICLLMGVSTVWAQQFSAVNADGQMIYYNVTDVTNHEVDVYESPNDNRYSGEINIPASVEYNGDTYSVTGIGVSAFCWCRNLTSVTIPNSVTTIGMNAFEGCSGIELIVVKALVPPTIEENSFEGVPNTIPVYVPCEALDAYLNDEQWSYFTNIQCDPSEGIEDVKELQHVNVYPNPTSGMITIEAEGIERVEVMNIVGRKVSEFKGESMINLSELGSRVYILRITTNEGTAIRRVIKK